MSGTVARAMAIALEQLEAGHVFTLMGAGNLRFIHHLVTETSTRVHHLRHENGSVGAADGFARATGRVGWCTVTQGPGFTNTITALRTAVMGRSPIVLITSDSSRLAEIDQPFARGIQGLAVRPLLDAIGVTAVELRPAHAAQDVERAHRLAAQTSMPVALVVPFGVEEMPVDDLIPAHYASAAPPRPAEEPSKDSVKSAAAVLKTSKRPVILAGRGATGAAGALKQLATVTGAHLSTSVKAVGLFADSPVNLGIFGGFTDDEASEVILAADCLVVVGASLNYFQTRRGRFSAGKEIIHIDRNAQALGLLTAPTVPVVGDAELSVLALIAELGAIIPEGSRSLPSAPGLPSFVDRSEPGALDPRSVAATIDQLLPQDRTVLVDIGHFGSFAISHLRYTEPNSMIWMSDFGAVGSALGAGIAAAIARPDRTTALFIGDCGYYMTLGDLELAVRESVPLVVVCMNDGAAGSELLHLSVSGLPGDEAIFGRADLAAVARGMGAKAASIKELTDLADALGSWSGTEPLVLDVHVSRDVRSPIYAHL